MTTKKPEVPSAKDIPLAGVSALACGICDAEFYFHSPTIGHLEAAVVEHFKREHPATLMQEGREK